jgi:hypothetical protein
MSPRPTHDRLIAFGQQYPALHNFLGGWFPDADFDGRSDEEVARDFARVTSPKNLRAVLEQAKRVLVAEPFPWQEVGEEANRYFESPEEARAWLATVLAVVEATSPTAVPSHIDP